MVILHVEKAIQFFVVIEYGASLYVYNGGCENGRKVRPSPMYMHYFVDSSLCGISIQKRWMFFRSRYFRERV
jgi:hypothetical protein